MTGKITLPRIAIICLLVALAFTSLFYFFPAIDLAVSQWLYVGYNAGLARHEFLWSDKNIGIVFDNQIDIFLQFIFYSLIPIYLIGLAMRKPVLGLTHRRFLFLILTPLISITLFSNFVFKEHWGRARPDEIIEFGSYKSFSPAWQISGECQKNCSFISGHTALAFSTLAFALLAAKRRAFLIVASIAFGCLAGFARFARGAHFISDVTVAGLLTVLVVLILYEILRPEPLKYNIYSKTPVIN